MKRLLSVLLIFCLLSINVFSVCTEVSAAAEQINSIERERILFAINHDIEDIAAKAEAEHRAKIQAMIENYNSADIYYTESELEKNMAMLSDGFSIAADICEAIICEAFPSSGKIVSSALSVLSTGCGELKKSEADKTKEMLQQMMDRIDSRFNIVDEKLSLVDEKISSMIPELKEYFTNVDIQTYYAAKFTNFREAFKDKDEEGVEYETYSEWKTALRKAYNALEECHKNPESAKILQEHYELLYLHSTDASSLYSYIVEDHGDSHDYSIAKIYYDFLVMSDYIGRSSGVAKDDITWETVSYINDLYHTYMLAKYSHIISLLYRAQIMDGTVESDGITSDRYREITETALKNSLKDFSTKVNNVKYELTEDLAYALALDLSYTYAVDENNPDSYINVPYYYYYDVNTENETKVTNNQVCNGATILLNKLPKLADSVYDYSKLSFEITNGTSLATIDNNGKISVTGTSGQFTAAMKYDGKLIYSLDFSIVENPFSGGVGTAEFPYLVANYTDFKNIENHPDKHFLLVDDIDFSDEETIYISDNNYHNFVTISSEFSGVFDGGGHTISGMKHRLVADSVSAESEFHLGLFGLNSGTIKNLNIENFDLFQEHSEVNKNPSARTGFLCGKNTKSGLIEHVNVSNSKIYHWVGYDVDIRSEMFAGGICGWNDGSIKNCKVTNTNITAKAKTKKLVSFTYVGGISGFNYGTVTDCFSAYNNMLSGAYCGSEQNWIGKWSSGTCYARIGGIVGTVENGGKLSRCLVVGNILTPENSGGAPNGTYMYSDVGVICSIAAANSSLEDIHEYDLSTMMPSTPEETYQYYGLDISIYDNFEENGWIQKENDEPYFEKPISKVPSSYQIYLPKEIKSTSISLESLPIYEYAISECGGTSGQWQKNATFNNLLPGTPYKIYVRTAENKVSSSSASTAPVTVFTIKNTISAPDAPVLLSKTTTSIILQKKDGYEYSLDKVLWQDSNEFYNLSGNTEYTLYQRISENDTDYASESSTGILIKTDEEIKTTSVIVENNETNNSCIVNYKITPKDLLKSPVFYIAFYNNKNALLKIEVKDENIIASDEFSVNVPQGTTKCKVMLWESYLTPMCKADDCFIQ